MPSNLIPFSRTDSAYARSVFERLLPDADVRRSVLKLLASLIESANVEPSKWGVTLHGDSVALNVGGGLYTFYLSKKFLGLYWIGVQDEEEPNGTRASFKRLENSRAVERQAEELVGWFERLKPRLERFITHTNTVSRTALMPQSQRSHSPGVLRYLEEELETTIPDPSYPAPTRQTFTWIPFFADLTAHVLTYRDRQPELIDLLKQLRQQGRKIAPLVDQNATGQTIPLLVHDPFTFFSHFCRGITFANQKAIFTDLKSQWELDSPIPTDLKGVPNANNQKAWFFSYESHRDPSDIDSLWDIAEQVVLGPDAITEEAWRNALHVRQVGLAKLTMGFFWLNPNAFLPLDQGVRKYLNRAGVSVPDPITLSQYRTLLIEAQDRLQMTLPEISYAAFQGSPTLSIDDPSQTDESMPLPTFSLNTILYGPPGTGKTYETARRAVETIDGTTSDDRTELMARYRQLQREGQIGFVTFHQSYAYEDFIEGIRPVMDEEEGGGSPRYRIVDGILKELALRALGAVLVEKSTTSKQSDFLSLWDDFLAEIYADPSKTYPGLSPGSEFTFEVYKGDRIAGTNVKSATSKSKLRTNRVQMEKVWDDYSEKQDTINTPDAFKTLTQSIHASIVCAVYKELKSLQRRNGQAVPASARLNLSNEEKAADFIENGVNSRYAIGSEVPDRYVLIVDEINRGNISKILGELITLLEDDKRIGEDNELTVTLPYSREPFALPPNLYLIGTMNTADKSLALLDVALRRRFTFEELTPDFSVCGLAPEMQNVLEELNRRITLRKDRDHRIGHAFFMRIGSNRAAFNTAFQGKILPLLQEYFFNDWDGVRYVLGDTNDTSGFVVALATNDKDKGIRNRWQWYTDAGTTVDALAQLQANYGYNQTS